jgi:dipeptidyl aminopeptidase/acylaminoacyl peptidase
MSHALAALLFFLLHIGREEPTFGIERFLHVRSATGPRFSPDGEWIAFRTNITGVNQVWKIPAEGGWPEQLTFFEENVGALDWSPDGRWIVFEMDEGGNERNQIWIVSPDGAIVKNLTNRPEAVHNLGGISPDGSRVAFTSNRRNPTFFDVYVLDVPSGATECVWQDDGMWYAGEFSPDGKRLLLSRLNGSLDNDLFFLDLASKSAEPLTPHEGPTVYEAAGSADGRFLYVATNAEREFAALMRFDLATRAWTPLAEPSCEVEGVWTSKDGRYLAYATNVEGRSEIAVRDLRSGSERKIELEPGTAVPTEFSRDGRFLAFATSTPRDPGDVWVYDLETDAARPVTRSSRAGIPREALVVPQYVQYESFDGRRIPALFFRPEGLAPDERIPCVVLFHGGPESQTRPSFNPIVQYFVQRGYAVFAPNVRGSTGFGRTFTHLDDVRRREDSVRDGAFGVEWLRKSGVVDPRKIVAYGGSYGGYMVLAALTLHPELWAAGCDFVGIANFVTFLEKTSPYRRRHRASEYGSLEEDREFLETISPIHKVDRIACPLVVVHGANDPRVPIGEAEQIVEALRARGMAVEFLRYEDEGHGISKLKNRIDAYPKVVAFLDRVLSRAPQEAATTK